MSARQLDALEQRLISAARALSRRYAAGTVTLDTIRATMRDELARDLAAAVLVGTGAQRNAEIDALITGQVNGAWQELDDLIALIADADVSTETVSTRLEAFADYLEQARDAGEEQAQRDDISPLVPIVIGGAVGALIGAVAARGAQPPATSVPGGAGGRVSLPRVDMGQIGQLTTRLQADMDALSAQLANGELSVDDWYAAMRDQLRRAHGAYYRLGRGTTLTPQDMARLNERLARQYEFLDGWRDELASGDMRSEAAIRARARMYLDAGNASLQDGRGAAIGLPPLPAVPGDGTTVCRTNCKCTWRIVQLDGAGNYDCYWRLRPAEHCPTCEARALAWSPIRARGGRWEPFPTVGLFE